MAWPGAPKGLTYSTTRGFQRKKIEFQFTAKQNEVREWLNGPQIHSLIYGGARSGKTFLIVRAIVVRALKAPGSRHAILRLHGNAARKSIWLDTLPKVFTLAFPGKQYHKREADGYLTLDNGSEIWVAGLDDSVRVERILGTEYSTLFLNEASQIPYNSVTLVRTRLSQQVYYKGKDGKEKLLQPKCFVDLNPTSFNHWTYLEFISHISPISRQPIDPGEFAATSMQPWDNKENLPEKYIERVLEKLPERMRKRFLEGQYAPEVDNALWSVEVFEANRVEEAPDLQRIVVSVDPSGASGPEDKRSDEIGIVTVGLGFDGHAYVLSDVSGRMSPETWAARAILQFRKYKADLIIAERNFGGAMVKYTIESQAQIRKIWGIKVEEVVASRGKAVRAEPISALYAEGRVHHVCPRHGDNPLLHLEDQLLGFAASGYYGEKSPDRADALVWAVSYLLLEETDAVSLWEAFGGALTGDSDARGE
jgi:hypothetical protein